MRPQAHRQLGGCDESPRLARAVFGRGVQRVDDVVLRDAGVDDAAAAAAATAAAMFLAASVAFHDAATAVDAGVDAHDNHKQA